MKKRERTKRTIAAILFGVFLLMSVQLPTAALAEGHAVITAPAICELPAVEGKVPAKIKERMKKAVLASAVAPAEAAPAAEDAPAAAPEETAPAAVPVEAAPEEAPPSAAPVEAVLAEETVAAEAVPAAEEAVPA